MDRQATGLAHGHNSVFTCPVQMLRVGSWGIAKFAKLCLDLQTLELVGLGGLVLLEWNSAGVLDKRRADQLLGLGLRLGFGLLSLLLGSLLWLGCFLNSLRNLRCKREMGLLGEF